GPLLGRIDVARNVYRSADRVTKNVLVEHRYRGAEEIARIQRRVAEVFKGRAVEVVRPRFGGEQNHGALQQSVLNAVVILKDSDFLNGIRVRSNRRLGHVPGVHVPQAVQGIEGAARAHAIDGHGVAGQESARTFGHTRSEVGDPG